MKREIELDFLRGVAILLVLDFHAPRTTLLAPFTWLGFRNFGWVGVDIFFVLSGFLVGGLLIKEWSLRERIDARRFLIRRSFKIWPQYYIYLLLALLTGHKSLHSLRGNLLNLQNYVGGIPHTWTLAVEEHAYLLFVTLVALAAHFNLRPRTLFLLVSSSALAVLAWRTLLAAHHANIFTRTDTRVDGILYGFLLAMLYHRAPAAFRRIQSWTWCWLTLIGAALVYLRLKVNTWWSDDIAFVCGSAIGVALLLLLYRHVEGKPRPALFRLVAWVGVYSYGIYLWHVATLAPIALFARRLPAPVAAVFITVAPILAAIGVGVLATKAIEFPALTLRDLWFPRPVDSAAGIPAELERTFALETAQESLYAENRSESSAHELLPG